MVTSKCPNCNAPLVWQKDRKVYLCEYCKAEFRDETAPQEAAEQKVIHEVRHEYHVVSEPAGTTPVRQAAEERKKNPGCLRAFLAVLGIGCGMFGAAGFGTGEPVLGIFMIGAGIWMLVIAGRRK